MSHNKQATKPICTDAEGKEERPIREDFLTFGAPLICEDEVEEVAAALRSGWLSTGPRVHRFEVDFKAYIGCKYALSLNSCTAGLHLALDVLDIGEGDEVITTPLTFCATANVVLHRRARPVFVDVERETGNIDPEKIEQAITPRTKAIVPVHLYGRPCRMDDIMEIAREHKLYVIEDAAHATEAWYKGKKVGAIGDLTAFSFYATKNLVTGEGGMITTNSDEWAEAIRVKRLHGLSRDAWKRYAGQSSSFQPYDVVYPGYKYNMMDIQAALGIHQLARLEENLKIRERHWRRYNEAFANISEITIPKEDAAVEHIPACAAGAAGRSDGESATCGSESDTRHARHLYTILLDLDRLSITRNELVDAMKAEGIGTSVHFIALHLHKYYRDAFGYKGGEFPNAELISARTVSLPLSAKLSDQDVEDVIRAVQKVVASHALER